jgi:hypothetical protein
VLELWEWRLQRKVNRARKILCNDEFLMTKMFDLGKRRMAKTTRQWGWAIRRWNSFPGRDIGPQPQLRTQTWRRPRAAVPADRRQMLKERLAPTGSRKTDRRPSNKDRDRRKGRGRAAVPRDLRCSPIKNLTY